MKLQKTPAALAAFALCAGMPFFAHAAPTVSIKTPASGQTLSGRVNGANCEVNASSPAGISRVTFWANSWQINNDYSAPWNCDFDTTRLKDGPYTFKAVAYDSKGVSTTSQISVKIDNSGTSTSTTTSPTTGTTSTTATPAPSSGSLDVWFKAPLAGATVSGVLTGTKCYVAGAGVTKVAFFLDSTALNTDTVMSDGMQCRLDTAKFANGTHQLKATAYSSTGATRSDVIGINVQNAVANQAPTVAFSSPKNGNTVSDTLSGTACEVLAADDKGVKQVEFFLGTTLIGTDTTAPYNCTLDTKRFANGSHTLKAVATDTENKTGSTQVSLTIDNAATVTAPSVSFKAPLNGQTVKGWLDGVTCEALATSSAGISQVVFFMDSTQLNTEKLAPWNCTADTSKYADGAHVLKAVATDAKGVSSTAQANLTVQNGTPTTTNQAPSVAFTAPTAGQTVSGTLAFAANAADDKGVAKVVFSVDATTLATRTAAPWTGSVDTGTLPNGTHQLKAVAHDAEGLTATSQVAINVQNTASLPAGGKAVATFESLGLYWTPPSNPGAAGCTVTYRRSGDAGWKDGLALWYDARNSECRGSLVHLSPATAYEVQFGMPGQQPSAQLTASTWSESFPIAKTVYVPSGTTTFAITEGGTPNGYVLYASAPGTQAVIDVADAQDYNVTVAAPYVIVRGLTLKGAKQDGIRLLNGAYNVVIEDNDISGWGRYRATNSAGWKLGMDMDAGVRAACSSFSTLLERVVIQRNKIHDPRYGANSWSWGHPAGPQGITLSYCGGNHVIRYNEIYSGDKTRYFNDAIGGEDNFSTTGFPNADTDIHGNKISNAWDDAIEAEGGNKNVRIWGNYIDQTAIGIASTVVHHGPLYIFRNVYNRSRQLSEAALDSDDRNTSLKAGTVSSYGNGRRYVFHNTTLQATQPGVVNPLGAGAGLKGNSGQPLTNTVSRNNVFHVWKSGWSAIAEMGGSGNDLDYDLRNGGVSAYSGAEQNGLVGFPQYEAGHGWQSESGGLYQLAPTSPGYDRGVRLPNFNDGYTGAGPDMGAHEAGTPAMRLGVNGSGVVTQ